MTQRGVVGVLAGFVVLLIGATVAVGWYVLREPPVPLPTWEGAVWAPDDWDSVELLDVDDDGSLLVAFYVDARTVTGYDDVKVDAGQLPGVALVTPDGEAHVLRETSPVDKNAIGSVVGSVFHADVAIAWQVSDDAVRADGSVTYSSTGRTVSLATGTVDGLSEVPTPTLEGMPVVVQWGGLHVADGALVAFVAVSGDVLAGTLKVGLIDTATGEVEVIDEGTMLAPQRDLCDPGGNTFGADIFKNNVLVVRKFAVVGGQVTDLSIVSAPPVGGTMLPVNACGADSAGVVTSSKTLHWTDGAGKTSMSQLDGMSGDVFLAPAWLAVHVILPGTDINEVVVVDRVTRSSVKVSDSCARVVPAGDWLAFGVPDGDKCRLVAVPVSELLSA
ncbi:MAG: hypothetical protein HGA51_01560 [Demequinaceae bacterium]|nr:hypothetical protein [Demequinaceae bacterium]